MLKTRIITAIVLIAAFIPALFMLSTVYWAIMMLLITLLALREWAQMVDFNSSQIVAYVLISLAIGVYIILRLQQNNLHQFFYQSLRSLLKKF